jgi:uncharacterized membrane protein
MGTDTGLYKFVLLCHIVAVVVGIGTMMLNGVYAAKAKKAGGAAAGAIMQANFDVTMVAEKIIYTIPVFGILLVVLSDKVFEFSQAWIGISIVLYIIGLGIAHGVMIPSSKRMFALGATMGSGQGGAAEVAEAEAVQRKLAAGGMALDLLAVALIALMIWKPGL